MLGTNFVRERCVNGQPSTEDDVCLILKPIITLVIPNTYHIGTYVPT